MPIGLTSLPFRSRRAMIPIGCGLLGALTMCSVAAVLLWTLRVQTNAGPITLSHVTLTTGIQPDYSPIDNVVSFNVQQPVIYCVVTLSAPAPTLITVRWFRQDQLIREDRQMVESRGVWFILPEEGTHFAHGEYRLEVRLDEFSMPARVIYFTVN